MLLSPVGVPLRPSSNTFTENKNHRGPPACIRKIATQAWKYKWSPFGLMRKSGGLIGRRLIKGYMQKRMGMLPKEEFDSLHLYMHQIFMKDGSTEYAIFVQFQLGMYAVKPLEIAEKLGNKELNLPISFFYGDIDWMDESAGRRVLENNIYGGLS